VVAKEGSRNLENPSHAPFRSTSYGKYGYKNITLLYKENCVSVNKLSLENCCTHYCWYIYHMAPHKFCFDWTLNYSLPLTTLNRLWNNKWRR